MFSEVIFTGERPDYIQLKEHIKQMISRGALKNGQRLPSTRELAAIVNVSRNTVISSYQHLEDEGFLYAVKGKGTFVADIEIKINEPYELNWKKRITDKAILAEELDLLKHGVIWEKGMIAFTSIAPDEKLFDVDAFKKAFLNRFSLEGEKLLNYGYAKGYRPLLQYLMKYMENKGVATEDKDLLIVNGFTEGFELILTALCCNGGRVICENPTHNTAIKMMRMHDIKMLGIDMEEDGLDVAHLKKVASSEKADFCYLTPSYHNPTGTVMSPKKRLEVLKIMRDYEIPIIEDGFNEELRYSGSHIAPLIGCCGKGNGVVYIGSFSKILFPGLRIGWIFGDKELIGFMESLKRSRNIHTSTVDQAALYQYLHEGSFERYMKRVKKIYKHKFELALSCAKEQIPFRKLTGDGGLHIFVELDANMNSRLILSKCKERGVVFTPGDIFYTDGRGQNTMRLGFSRVGDEDIVKGFKVIGEVIRNESSRCDGRNIF